MTAEERITLTERRELFHRFLEELPDLLVDFCAQIGCGQPHLVPHEPALFVKAVDLFLRQVDFANVKREGRTWLLARLTCFIGEVLRKRFDGEWFLDENPDSRFFLSHVIGRFPRCPEVNVDPAEAALDLISQPPGRSLADLVENISALILERSWID